MGATGAAGATGSAGAAGATGVTDEGFITASSLFQINFLPLFTHLNFLPAIVVICPAFLQLAPAFIAACALMGAIRERIKARASRIFFMGKVFRVNRRIATISLGD